MTFGIYKQVLRLDIAMAVSKGVNVGKCAECLISVQFDQEHGHLLLHFIVVLQNSVHSLWNVLHNHIQIYFVLLPIIRDTRSKMLDSETLDQRLSSKRSKYFYLPCHLGCKTRVAMSQHCHGTVLSWSAALDFCISCLGRLSWWPLVHQSQLALPANRKVSFSKAA